MRGGQGAQPRFEVGPGLRHLRQQSVILQLLEDEERRPRRQQVAAVGRAVIAGQHLRRHGLRDERGAHRHPRAERLADRDQVGREPSVWK